MPVRPREGIRKRLRILFFVRRDAPQIARSPLDRMEWKAWGAAICPWPRGSLA